MKKGFTLLEINLAIMIMAGGILSILGLYGLGYRESRQSRDDVEAAAYADAVISPLVMALSATNITWQAFDSIKSQPSEEGWASYLNQSTGLVTQNPDNMAAGVFRNILGKLGASGVKADWPLGGGDKLKGGLVVLRDEGSAVVRIAFRATRLPAELLAMPLFYTEVRFQGQTDLVQKEEKK